MIFDVLLTLELLIEVEIDPEITYPITSFVVKKQLRITERNVLVGK